MIPVFKMPIRSPDTSPALSLDTEFVWTKTYYARLGLVQAAPSPDFDRSRLPSDPPDTFPFSPHSEAEAQAVLIDPLSCSPSPMREILEDPDIVKIFHDAGQDAQHLARWTSAAQVRSVFDTRLAAGFCGLSASMSLAALLEETLGISLAKTETRTDWCRRPLSPEQLEYAAQDVAWLRDAALELLRRADAHGTRNWLFEEMADRERAISQSLTEPPPEQAWTRLHPPRPVRTDAAAFRRFQALAIWRERTARDRDLPRKWIVQDDIMTEAALRPPRTPQDLPRRALAPSFQRGFFDALRGAADDPRLAPPPSPGELARERERDEARRRVRDRVTAALDVIAKRAETLGVDPALIASRADATEWMLDRENPALPLNRGWRREALAGALDSFGDRS